MLAHKTAAINRACCGVPQPPWDPCVCPHCGGRMVVIERIEPLRLRRLAPKAKSMEAGRGGAAMSNTARRSPPLRRRRPPLPATVRVFPSSSKRRALRIPNAVHARRRFAYFSRKTLSPNASAAVVAGTRACRREPSPDGEAEHYPHSIVL